MNTSKLEVPIEKQGLVTTIAFLDAWARQIELPNETVHNLELSITSTLELLVKKNKDLRRAGQIQIEFRQEFEKCEIDILNSGIPMFPSDFPSEYQNGNESEKFEDVKRARSYTNFRFENRGRNGQRILIEVSNPGGCRELPNSLTASHDLNSNSIERHSSSETVIRPLRLGEEAALSRLFHRVYGYRYINDYIYYPEKIRQMIDSGKLVSLVAEMPDGSLAGHVGLIKWNNSPTVYEAALGVVDPSYKSNGLFGRIFKEVHELKNKLNFQYCIYDFVTNHELSQKLVAKYGYSDMALLLGSQVSVTQARLKELGIGSDANDMHRYSLLIAIEAGNKHPFGRNISLPTQIGEVTEFITKPLGLTWTPTPRFDLLPKDGEFTIQTQIEQKAAFIDFHQPGSGALTSLIEKWRDLLKNKFEYIAIDVPVNRSGLGQLHNLLSSHGFFMAGFVPYHYLPELAIRFQFLTPTKVSFENIKLHTPNGRQLLNMVRSDYERNTIL